MAARARMGKSNFPRDMRVGRGVRLSVTDGGKSVFGAAPRIDKNATVIVKYGHLIVGDNFHLGIGSVLVCCDKIEIGDNALIAEYVTIRDQDHAINPAKRVLGLFETASVRIGNNVWIGAKVTITRGVTIGDNAIIGANSVVTRDIPANVVAVGIPARPVKPL